jgi:integrase
VRELGEEFFRLNPAGLRGTTLKSRYSYFTVWIVPEIGHVKLRSLTVQHVHSVRARMRKAGKAIASINQTVATLSSIFGYGVQANLLSENPAAGVKWEEDRDGRDLPITSADDIARLLEAFQTSTYRVALMLGIGLGLRSGEARGLRWRDVDLERRVVHIRHNVARLDGAYHFTQLKTKSSRRDLPMPDFVYQELKAERRRQAERRLQLGPAWIDHDLVATYSGGVISHATLANEMVRLRRVTGIDGLVFHHLRHLCATVMMLNNVPPRIAQSILGHASTTTTMRIYQHVNTDALRDAADVLNAIFSPAIRDKSTG